MTSSPKINNSLSTTVEDPLKQSSRFRWMPIAICSTLLFNCYLTFKLLGLNKSAVTSRPYIYVQKTDGTVDKAQPVNELYRSDAVLKAYGQDWLKLAYTWRNSNPDVYVAERQIKYPLPLHTASFAIRPGKRETYLDSTYLKYQERFPLTNYISGQHQSKVQVFEQPVVAIVEPGLWDVTVIATRTHSKGNSVLAQETFNHVLRISAIDPGNQRLTTKQDSTLEKLLDKMQNQGLQIVDISQY